MIIIFADDDDEHSYHFRGKPELLAGISEENLLEQLEIEYLGDITSCNKVFFQIDIYQVPSNNPDIRLRTT